MQPLPAGPWFPQPGEVGTAGFGVHKLNSIPHALNGKKLTRVNFKKFQEKKYLIAKKKKKKGKKAFDNCINREVVPGIRH